MSKLYTKSKCCNKPRSRHWINAGVVLVFMLFFINGYAQNEKFVINLQDASLKEVMRAIKKQSGYSFLYQDDLIAQYGKRDFYIDTNSINAVMNVVLSDSPLTYEMEDNVIVLKPKVKPVRNQVAVQRIKVEGTVKDYSGQPLPGVSVLVKGTAHGTITNADGYYTIDANDTDILVFSFIGFTTVEKTLTGISSGVVDITMEESVSELGEVVVTGYQDIRKESFTGRAVTIAGADLKKVNPQNIFQSIQAMDPSFKIVENNLMGSNPNRLPEINVRGASGLPSGANQVDRNNLTTNPNLPTFILDGFEVTMQTVYDLDVNRIESITLLKDAAATAIYGSRAANGVLVITTKVPEEGKLQFSYNYEVMMSTPDLSVYDVLNASEKLEYEWLAGVYDSNSPRNNNAQLQDEYDLIYYGKKRLVLSGVDSYWLSEPVKTVFSHKNSFSIEGGSKSLRYGMTAQYQTMPGVMKESKRDRIGGDIYLSYNLNDKFLFRNTLSISQVNSNESPYGNFQNYIRMNPYYPKYDENGKLVRVMDEWVRKINGEGQTTIDAVLNPMYDATLSSFDKTKYSQVINSFSTTWNITDALLLKGLISFTKYTTTHDIFRSPLANQFYYYESKDLNKRGEYMFENIDEFTVDGNILLAYNKSIGRHMINGSIGGNIKDMQSDQKVFWARGFTNDRFDNIGFANSYFEGDSPFGRDETERLVGSFLSANYSYNNKYLLDVTGRLDGSSKFGSDKRVAPFWATGIGWNAHHEPFLSSVSAVNQLRLTATTGVTGGVAFPPHQGKTMYQYFKDWYSTGVGAEYISYGNNNLKWQRTQNFDVGMDVVLFNNRVTVAPTYYYKLTHDMIADVSVPPSLGFPSYKDNIGKMENKGYEIGLKLGVVQNDKWTVNLFGNFVHNENKLKSISNWLRSYNDEADRRQNEDQYKGTPLLRFYEGQSIDAIYAVRSLGIDPESGKEIFLKKDGTRTYVYDVKDITTVGDRTPTLYGFFGGSAAYKNFILYLSFYTRFGGDQYNQTLIDRVENADPRFNVDQRVLDQRWKKPGDVTFYKDIADTELTRASSRFVQADNLIELKSASLSYDAPLQFRSKLRMQMLRFVLTSNDVFRWSAIKMERGLEYPFARSVTFSIQTRF